MEKERITGNKDVDKLILEKIDSDRDLLKTCSVNSYFKNLCDDDFFRKRLRQKYPFLFDLKSKEISWKNYYLKSVYYIDKMKREYDFDFTSKSFGTPKEYYDILAGRKTNGKKIAFTNERDAFHWGEFASENNNFKDLQNYFQDKLHE